MSDDDYDGEAAPAAIADDFRHLVNAQCSNTLVNSLSLVTACYSEKREVGLHHKMVSQRLVTTTTTTTTRSICDNRCAGSLTMATAKMGISIPHNTLTWGRDVSSLLSAVR